MIIVNQIVVYISKKENFKIPIVGPFICNAGFLAIDRENGMRALRTLKSAAEHMKSEALDVGIYPEGTRNRGEGLLPFHDSILRIPQKAGVPIVVFTIKGTDKIAKHRPFRRTDVYINVLDVISAEEVTSTRSRILGAKIREEMELDISK